MAKIKRRKTKKPECVVEMASTVESNKVVAETKMTSASRYKMIPVDQQTHARLMALCSEYGFGQRGQGAMVRKLVNSEFERIPSIMSSPKL